MKLFLSTTGECLADNLLLANTAWTRLRGLMGKKSLAAGAALWLRPCNSVHTFWMRFALDVVFVDRQLRIVKLVENLRPFRLTAPSTAAHSVIEFPAHTIARFQLVVGQQLKVEK